MTNVFNSKIDILKIHKKYLNLTKEAKKIVSRY